MTRRATCRSCPFFAPEAEGFRANGGPDGTCHALPPATEGWPRVRRDDWCGEHPDCDAERNVTISDRRAA